MWEINNYDQIISFLLSICLGAIFCFIYDIIRAARRVCLNSFFAITVVDILLWVFYAFVTFIFLIARTDGEIRGYVLVGEMLGFIILRISVSRLLYLAMSFVFIKISIIKQRVAKHIKTFYLKIEKTIAKLYLSFLKKCKKTLENTRKLLYTNKNNANVESISNEEKTKT